MPTVSVAREPLAVPSPILRHLSHGLLSLSQQKKNLGFFGSAIAALYAALHQTDIEQAAVGGVNVILGLGLKGESDFRAVALHHPSSLEDPATILAVGLMGLIGVLASCKPQGSSGNF